MKFLIEDTAGAQRYRSLTSLYYKNAQVALCVYDCTNRDTFMGLKKWVEDLKSKAPINIIIVFIGNKIDKV